MKLFFLIFIISVSSQYAQLTAPILIAPPNNSELQDPTPTFEWSAVSGADHYTIQLSRSSSFSSIYSSHATGLTTWTPTTNLPMNGPFYWRVYAYAGGPGPYSTVWTFSIVPGNNLDPPILIAPPNNSELQDPTPTFEWSAVSGADHYTIQLSRSSSFSSIYSSHATGLTTWTPTTNLPMNGPFYWRVYAYAGGSGPYSTVWTFSIVNTTSVDDPETIKEFNLSHNYPNPFNPSTKIKYAVPQSSQVIIKVFDIIGNEIETVVNEQKNKGNYELTWYAGNLPSGIYLYQLRADSFVQTRKMVLMK